jgi:flavin-dependent dehydrogenase
MEHIIPVVIAGGGIAGMATALSLINRGIACLIVEPEVALTAKIGETIPPNATSLLAMGGIDHLLIDPAHLPCYGNHFIWGSSIPYEKSFFSQVNPHGWHLDRPFFEKQLRTHCISRGIEWLPGHRITHIEQHQGGWQLSLDGGGNAGGKVSCSFLVDATGRQARIARMLGLKRKRLDALVGISAQLTADCTTLPHYTYIEAVANGWWYAAPLANNKLSIVYMTDNDLVDKELTDINHFLRFARDTSLISDILKRNISTSTEETTLRPASTTALDERTGDRWLAVGDAAYAFDPISSYGIMSALEGGYYAGHAIADTLAGSADAMIAYDVIISQAFAIYLKMHTQQYAAERRWAGMPFWERRGIP